MRTKIRYILTTILLISTLCSATSTELFSEREIIELFNQKKYAILLEKSIPLLSGASGRLTTTEEAFLQFYTGSAYIKQGNINTGLEYHKDLEQKHPYSPLLRQVFIERAEIDKGDYFKWESWLLKVYNKFPNTKDAVKAGIRLVKSYLKLKNYSKASGILETIINLWKRETDAPESNILLALAYSGQQDYIEAVDYIKKAASWNQRAIDANPQYLFEAGNIYYNTQNFKEAISSHQRFINIYTKSPKLAEAAIQMADSYERTGNRYMAAIYLITVIRQKRGEPKDYAMYLNLSRILMNLKESDFKKISSRYPLESRITPILKEVRDKAKDFNHRREAVLLLATSLKRDNKRRELFDIYFDFLKEKRDKYLESIFKKTLDNYINELVQKEDYNSIANLWGKLSTRKSLLSGENLLKIAEMFYELNLLKNTEDIIKHLRKYTMYRSLHKKATVLLIKTEFKRNNYKKVLELLKRFKAVPPANREEFLFFRLIALQEENKQKEFTSELEKLKITPPLKNYTYKMALMKSRYLEKQGKFKEALKIVDLVIGFKKSSPGDYLLLKADLLYQDGKLAKALDLYNSGLQKTTNQQDWILYQKINIMKQMKKDAEIPQLTKELEDKHKDSYWLKQLKIDNEQQ